MDVKVINNHKIPSPHCLHAPLAHQESYSPSPRSLDMKDNAGEAYPVWLNPAILLKKAVNKETIVHTLKPFVTLGKAFGFSNSKTSPISSIVTLVVASLVGLALVRSFMFYSNVHKFDTSFVCVLLLNLHLLKCLVAIFYLRRLLGPESKGFYAMWEDVVEGGHHSSEGKSQTRKWVTLTCCLAFLQTLAVSAAFTLGTSNYFLQLPGVTSFFFSDQLLILNGFVMFFATLFEAKLQALYWVLCVAVYNEFKHMMKKMSKKELTTSEEVEVELAIFRLYHYQLINLTDRLDKMVSYYTFSIISINMMIICAVLFVESHSTNSIGTNISLVGWVIKLMLEILVITLPPSSISNVSCQPLFLVHEISNNTNIKAKSADSKETVLNTVDEEAELPNDDWLNDKIFQQTHLFVEQLSKRLIGITCGGFFVITKEALLTMASAMVTYFALVMQLDLSAQFHCQCSC